MSRYLLTLLMVVWACSAAAETWEWIDAQGTVSFTDEVHNIPKRYRGSAKKLGGERPPATPAPLLPGGDTSGSSAPGQPVAPPAAKPRESYGGMSASQWREAFTSLNGEIRGVDGELKEKQRLLKEPGTLSRGDYLRLEDEVRRLSASLTALLARWELLNKSATAANVPGELRQ